MIVTIARWGLVVISIFWFVAIMIVSIRKRIVRDMLAEFPLVMMIAPECCCVRFGIA